MLKMNLITRKELYGDLYWELYDDLYRELDGDLYEGLYRELYLEVTWELDKHVWEQLCLIRTNFSHSKISRV
jgi:hypothetical protein